MHRGPAQPPGSVCAHLSQLALLSQIATDGAGRRGRGLKRHTLFLTDQGAGTIGFLVRAPSQSVHRRLASCGHTRWKRGKLALQPFLPRVLIPFGGVTSSPCKDPTCKSHHAGVRSRHMSLGARKSAHDGTQGRKESCSPLLLLPTGCSVPPVVLCSVSVPPGFPPQAS